MGAWKEETGNTVTVYSKYHFAVPVRGMVRETNHNSFKVDFFSNNPGGHNVNKHDGTWFLKGQCKVDEGIEEVQPKAPERKEILSKWWKRPHAALWFRVQYYNPMREEYGRYCIVDKKVFWHKAEDFIDFESANIPLEE